MVNKIFTVKKVIIEIDACAKFHDAVMVAIKNAIQMSCDVEFEFNGRVWEVCPFSDEADALEKFHEINKFIEEHHRIRV